MDSWPGARASSSTGAFSARYTVALDTPKVRTSSLIDSPPARSDRTCRACAPVKGLAADLDTAVEALLASRTPTPASDTHIVPS